MSDGAKTTIRVRCRLRLVPAANFPDGWMPMWDDSSPADPQEVAVIVEVEVPVAPRVVAGRVVERQA